MQLPIPSQKKRNQGFTLIETLIVVVILGVIAAVTAPTISNALERRAAVRQIESVSDTLTQNARQLIIATGAPASVTATPLIRAGNDFLDILAAGEDFIAAGFEQGYQDAGIMPIDRLLTTTTAAVQDTSTGVYEVSGYVVTINSPNPGELATVVAGVPSEIVERLVNDREGGGFDAGTADTAGAIQYDVAAADGTHNLTMLTRLN